MVQIGIDIGSMYVKVVCLDQRGGVAASYYQAHNGEAERTLFNFFNTHKDEFDGIQLSLTGQRGQVLADSLALPSCDGIRSSITAVRERFPSARNIIDIGGGTLTLIRLNHSGELMDFSTNSLCAAGTGAFLDEQAERLQIGPSRLNDMPLIINPPMIATRCAVFAKSDLIHHQQEGRSREEMWSGLCRGMVETMLSTLLKGRPLHGLTVVIGGVTQNSEVWRWLDATPYEIVTFAEAPFASAIGAAMESSRVEQMDFQRFYFLLSSSLNGNGRRNNALRPTLLLNRSNYPSFELLEHYTDASDNEIRISSVLLPGKRAVMIGVDIGSTSTKLAVVDAIDETVIIDIYRRTMGEPVEATKKIFSALRSLCLKKNMHLVVIACGTTGSGRKLIGNIIGADAVINEISAHVTGAKKVDATIETIFEIGGQDAKFMHVKNGAIFDANMNYVCAAGTGSFIEELAKRLGWNVHEIGAVAYGVSPPYTSDRCTVFMDQDVRKLLRQGYSRQEALASVLYSVIQNYLNRVVGNRRIASDKIMFQGATARNKALVAALENLLDVEVVVSPYCHIMGAYGVALLARKEITDGSSRFRAFNVLNRRIEINTEICDLCNNHCRINHISLEGEPRTASWGYQCGRDSEEAKPRFIAGYHAFERQRTLFNRAPTKKVRGDAPLIVMPRSLSLYTYAPFWREFFAYLGFRTSLTPYTNEKTKQNANKIIAADYCFPVKATNGHFISALENQAASFVFYPAMIADNVVLKSSSNYFCPYLQSVPSILKASAKTAGLNTEQFLTPVLDFSRSDCDNVNELEKSLGKALGVRKNDILNAYRAATVFHEQYRHNLVVEGVKILADLDANGKQAIVIIGRPYNVCDRGLNLNLPRKIAEYGMTVLPLEMLPIDVPGLAHSPYYNLFWSYGQKIIAALRYIKQTGNLFPVYFTNFNCGPDSFLLTYAEEEMAGRPMLTLELDEHDADGGYLTRVEAFLDVLHEQTHDKSAMVRKLETYKPGIVTVKNRTIWFPPMHEIGTSFIAAVFRGHGYNGQPLPLENQADFNQGRFVTRGSECLPTALTIGVLLNTLRREKADAKHTAFFMPTAEGPCRFGQYCHLHRLILDKSEFAGVEILAPSSINSYQGLPERLRRGMWHGLMCADLIMKALLMTRPYERTRGDANDVCRRGTEELCRTFEKRGDPFGAIEKALRRFERINRFVQKKPLVGIVGEIYVRSNPYANEHVVEAIEKAGGEAWLAPIHEWILYTTYIQQSKTLRRHFNMITRGQSLLKNILLTTSEKQYYRKAGEFLANRHEPSIERILAAAAPHIPLEFVGEAALTIGRSIIFAHDGAAMVVNCAPFGCMVGTITTGILSGIQNELGIPVVSQFYDGEGDLNKNIASYLSNINNGSERHRTFRQNKVLARGTGETEKSYN